MVGWIILAVLVGLIALIMLIPIGADIRYEDGVVRVSAKAAGKNIQLIPKKKTEPKPEKPKEEKPKPEKPEKEKPRKQKKEKERSIPFNAEEILEILKSILRRFGRFGKKFKVDRFVLHWIAAGRDPYIVARVFAVVNAGLSELAPICGQRFHCKDSSVWTDIDFVRDDMFFEFGITTTIRIGQIVSTGIGIGFDVVKTFLRSKRRVKREAKEEKQALDQWLADHPEEAEVYRAELQQEAARAAEAKKNAQTDAASPDAEGCEDPPKTA